MPETLTVIIIGSTLALFLLGAFLFFAEKELAHRATQWDLDSPGESETRKTVTFHVAMFLGGLFIFVAVLFAVVPGGNTWVDLVETGSSGGQTSMPKRG